MFGQNPDPAHEIRHNAGRLQRVDGDGVRVWRRHRPRRAVGGHRIFQRRRNLRVIDGSKAEDHVFCREWVPVGENGAVTQMVRPREAVGRDLPLGREKRHDLLGYAVEASEPDEQLAAEFVARNAGRHHRIERLRCSAADNDESTAVPAGLSIQDQRLLRCRQEVLYNDSERPPQAERLPRSTTESAVRHTRSISTSRVGNTAAATRDKEHF